jgi:hypothetical protein
MSKMAARERIPPRTAQNSLFETGTVAGEFLVSGDSSVIGSQSGYEIIFE